jgi:uncharacterized BrkB/YihY/UPF0761 family membrane protein
MWLYLSADIVLAGAEFNSAIETPPLLTKTQSGTD